MSFEKLGTVSALAWVYFFLENLILYILRVRDLDNTSDQTLKIATQGNCISMRDIEIKTKLAWKLLIKPELNWILDLKRELNRRL